MIEAILPVITALVALAVGALTARKVVSKGTLSEAYAFATRACLAAEEVFGAGGPGEDKAQYVLGLLLNRFNLSEDEARMLIDAAVKGLRVSGVKADTTLTDPPPAAALKAIG